MKEKNISKRRLLFLMFFFLSVFILLSVRLFYLQSGEDPALAVMASGQHVTELKETEERAGIYDRNGMEITGGETYLCYYTEEEKIRKQGTGMLERYGCEEISSSRDGYCVWSGDDNDSQKISITAKYGCTAVTCRKRYSDNQKAVHLIGYTGISEEDGEETGICGLEKMFDERLRKGAEKKYLYRDAAGKYLGGNILSDREIREQFRITVDLGIQEEAEKILDETGNPGGIIVCSIDSGEILAYASYPAYNPNDVASSLDSSFSELTDRLSGASYPPGSVFKLVVAAAAMEAGIAQEDTIFDCSGSIQVGGTVVRCSTGGKTGHGEITLREALENSCNCAFIELGIKTGGERILDMAEKMGLGRDVCPQISEVTGNLPSDAAECGIANLSIGQGTLLVTPLQITAMMRGIAGGGVFSQLRVLTGDTQKDLEKYGVMPEGVLRETTGENRRILSKSTVSSLLSMMGGVTDQGTAAGIQKYTDAAAGGKTGSAQSSMSGRNVVHGWFSGFYPQNDPEYVITVFMEDSGGSSVCIPAAGKMIDWLSRNVAAGEERIN